MSDALTSLDRLLQSHGDLPFNERQHSAVGAVFPSYLEIFSNLRRDFLSAKYATRWLVWHRFVDEFPLGKAHMAIV